jgi:hypothetical protein
LHRLVEKSEEDCEVNCSQEFDFKKGIVVTRRGDTGEIVERREITPDERQDDLFED